jgi:hypothetical protein
MDPFSVDFDPRWAKRLAAGSLGRQRYLDHVTDQALAVLRREEVGVLCATPAALADLERKMSDRQRGAVRGVHHCGRGLTAQAVNRSRAAFPEAVHLAGYGNTLFGVLMEVEDGPRRALDYFDLGRRLHFEVVSWPDAGRGEAAWPPARCREGERGRVLFHRLDEGCLLVGVVEGEESEVVPPSAAARELGATANGLRDPRPEPSGPEGPASRSKPGQPG